MKGNSAMWHRVKQVWSALNAKLTPEDNQFLDLWLSPKEKVLFQKCDLVTQKHSLRVAYTALELAKSEKNSINSTLLIKGALLHDIGKRKGDLTLWTRILTVLVFKLSPEWGEKKAQKGKGLKNALYTYLYHPQIGAEFAVEAGLDDQIINIIKNHHHYVIEPIEQRLIVEADNLN